MHLSVHHINALQLFSRTVQEICKTKGLDAAFENLLYIFL